MTLASFPPRVLAPLLVALGTLGAVSFAHAQPGTTTRPTAPAPLNEVTVGQALNLAERTQNSQALLLLYGQAVTTPDLARGAISQLLANFYVLRNGAQTADQATQAVAEAALRFQVFQAAQNQVLVQQNQEILQQNARIITLLEAQNRARGVAVPAPNAATR